MQEEITLREHAEAILAETDGLKVLEPGTYGYMMAVNAVERALEKCSDAISKQNPVGHFINITEYDKPTHEWQQAADQFKDDKDVVPLYRHPFAFVPKAKQPVVEDEVTFRYEIKGTNAYSSWLKTSRKTAEATFRLLEECGLWYVIKAD